MYYIVYVVHDGRIIYGHVKYTRSFYLFQEKLPVRPGFSDLPIIHDDNSVDLWKETDSMRNKNSCFTPKLSFWAN
jgi:hypothetical protein